METLGYIAALAVGLSLGIIGGGGSILTVPILTYLFGKSAVVATGYSLFIVGITSLIGAWRYHQQGLINYRIGAIFALPSFVGVFFSRAYVVPNLPDPVWRWEAFTLSKDALIMLVFAAVMIMAAASMLRPQRQQPTPSESRRNHGFLTIAGEGLVVGAITGFVGAGGGFLIIPALVILVRLPMKEAIGTSLMIMSIKSLFGFTGDVITGPAVDWGFLAIITAIASMGIVLGSQLVHHISSAKLKPIFGWFVLVMGMFIFAMQLL